ncbi:hypothetical protein DB29_03210 [Shouchella clausii]|nr:hypothetical protein DB29_03210 [Shouchella clausii]
MLAGISWHPSSIKEWIVWKGSNSKPFGNASTAEGCCCQNFLLIVSGSIIA